MTDGTDHRRDVSGSETSEDAEQPTTRLSRRRLVALAVPVPVALAGCFEEPEPQVDGGGAGAENGEAPDPDVADDDDDEQPDPGDDANGTDDDADDDSGGEDAEGDDDDGEGTPVPDRVDPEDAGVTVTEVEIIDVEDRNSRTVVTARLAVRNDGRFTYGTLEFRADAYKTRPNDPTREAVAFEYVTRRFASGNRFEPGDHLTGTRRFTVDVEFRSRDGAMRAHPDWYEVDAAVRRAEPSED